MSAPTLRVPGNLLLFGEYAVLEQGGLGIACALAPHVTARAEDAPGFALEGRFGARSVGWRYGEEDDEDELLPRAAHFLVSALQARDIDPDSLDMRVVVDSSEFVSAEGNKRGFGSSAAATVALTEAVCRVAGVSETRERFELAVRAHRAAQGGRGSGYDVAASFFGGIGIFRGGEIPEFERANLEWMPTLSLFETGAPASTGHAVSRYAAWKTSHATEATEFLSRSNSLVAALARAESWTEARAIVADLTALGRGLGESIGVPARSSRLDPDGDSLCKAVGAGAELFVCFGAAPSGDDSTPVEIDREGTVWS